jgi:hypothetical protein
LTERAAGAAPEVASQSGTERPKLPSALVIHRDIAAWALASGDAMPYRLYVVARERLFAGQLHGPPGRPIRPRDGVVSRNDLIGRLATLPGTPLGDRRNVRKVLSEGEGTYWDTLGDTIRFPAPDTLAALLGLPCAGHRVTAYPLAQLPKGAAAFRALLCDSLMPTGPKRLARATVAAMTHTSPSTQKRHEAAGGALYHNGAGLSPIREPRTRIDLTLLAPSDRSAAFVAQEFRHEGVYANQKAGGEIRLYRQAPKCYQAGTPSKRRKPRKPCIGHRLTGHPPGTRFLGYGAQSAKVRVAVVPVSKNLLEAVPRSGDVSLGDFFKASRAWRPVQTGLVIQGRGVGPIPFSEWGPRLRAVSFEGQEAA